MLYPLRPAVTRCRSSTSSTNSSSARPPRHRRGTASRRAPPDRSTDTISVTPICDFWPGLAGYDEYNGYAAGMWRGPSYIDGFTADLTDPRT